MAEIMLNVPHYKQRMSMSCWFASARMVKCYKQVVQVTGLPDFYANNWGVKMPEVIRLAEVEGFKFLPKELTPYTVHTLLHTLSKYGPLWVNTTTGGGGQHAVVITGVSNEMGEDLVFFNDPGYDSDKGLNAQAPLEQFNRLASPTQQLYYPPNMS